MAGINLRGRTTYGFDSSRGGGGTPRHRSTPGAPLADPTKNIGSVGQKYGQMLPGLTPASNWENAFRNHITGANTATGKISPNPAATPAAPPAGTFGLNNNFHEGAQLPGPQDELPSLATIASGGVTPHQERWAGGPPLSSPDRSMPGAPFMPRGPNVPFTVPKPLSSPAGNAGTDAAELDANKSIYSPGGTAGMFGGGSYAPRQVTPNPLAGTGSETGIASNIYQKYGNGSANSYRYSTGNGDTSSMSFGWGNAFGS